MPHISFNNKEIVFKLVYWGPGYSGKTTNLACLHRSLDRNLRGELVSLETSEERTLFFDFMPMHLGAIAGYTVRLNVYTVPGQIFYEASRRLILEGADGVVFVADSQTSRLEANLMSFVFLKESLASHGVDWTDFPIVLQYNKRDLEDLVPVGTMEAEFELNGIRVLEAEALHGRGVLETMGALTKLVIGRFDL
jgi:signal recognition particle receptor subunit beta